MQTTNINQKTASFWDRTAPRYAKQPIKDPDAYEQKISYVRGFLSPDDRVLEIGCGTGGTALRLASAASEVLATDISETMIEFANAKLGAGAPTNVRFLQAEAHAPFGEQSFDAICAFSLLHLVDDIPEVLMRVKDQLKPGGLFFSKTVCLKENGLAIRLFVRALTALGIAPPIEILSKEELVLQLETAGFEIVKVMHFGNQSRNPFIVARRPNV